jgi:uncharacterized protein YpbB
MQKKATPKRVRKEKTDDGLPKLTTQESSYNLFKNGKTILEIAVMRSLTAGTIEGHIAACIEKGLIEITEVMPFEKYKDVVAIMKEKGDKTYTEMRELHPNISFGEMRMAEAGMKLEAIL